LNRLVTKLRLECLPPNQCQSTSTSLSLLFMYVVIIKFIQKDALLKNSTEPPSKASAGI
jgi:hypothetical protein